MFDADSYMNAFAIECDDIKFKKILKELKYDGFFNYESHEYSGKDIYPSIGLFDENNLIIEKTLRLIQ